MAVLLPGFCLIAIFIYLTFRGNLYGSLKEVLIKSVLLFSVLIVFITESLSVFKILDFNFVLISWSIVAAILIFLIYKNKNTLLSFRHIVQNKTSAFFAEQSPFKIILFSIAIGLLALIFFQGIIYPPNNWDSMTYHMARIPNWISHHSVAHYPTHIIRQIYQPPFAEFVIMHVNLLSKSDCLSNSVQFFYFIFSLIAVSSLVSFFNLDSRLRFIVILLTLAMPEAVLQASSTQNDLVLSFFILSAVYFSFKCIKDPNSVNYFFLGISAGLGLLTKGTAYILLTPILLMVGIDLLLKIYKSKNNKLISGQLIVAALILLINAGHYLRNYSLNSNILGVDMAESKVYSNEKMTPVLFVSNVIKNAGLHEGPYPINRICDKVLYKIHLIAGIDINSSRTNYENIAYSGSTDLPTNEDSAANSIQFYLSILTAIFIFIEVIKRKTRIHSAAVFYLFILISQTILFCLFLKWQPWHTRLHLPIFFLSIPFVIYIAQLNNKFLKIVKVSSVISLFIAIVVVLINTTRPYITNRFTKEIKVTDPRFEKYFANQSELYQEYHSVKEEISSDKFKNIGLLLAWNDYEYPIFTEYGDHSLNPVSINVSNYTKKIPAVFENVDCIVSTTENRDSIEYKEKYFINQSKSNKHIWLYK